MPPKKASPGITVLLIDAGVNMSEKTPESEKTDFENAIHYADMIISRKLFADDSELFTVLAYNLDPKEHNADIGDEEFKGVAVFSEEFSNANFNHLKFILQEIQQNNKHTEPNFFKGALAASALLKQQVKESPNPAGITLIVLTNGINENLRQENYDLIVDSVSESNADLMIIGIKENPDYPASRIVELVESLEGRTYSYKNVEKMLSSYQARQKTERKFNKMWDIAPGIRLPVTFAVKSEKAAALLKFKNADAEGNEMVRVEQMHVETDDPVDIPKEDIKLDAKYGKTDKTDKNYKPVENIKLMHGYNFGKSVIMMDPEYLKEKYNDHNFNEGQTGGVLKLIQFTKKANVGLLSDTAQIFSKNNFQILDSYLVDSSAKTVLPSLNAPKSGATKATVAIIQAMLDLRVVALCRYTFHAKSHVQLIALIPHKDEETGVLYMRSVKLPFSDDMRTLKFPKFSFDDDEVDSNKPTVAQLSAVDDLIDCMQLPESDISSLVEGGMSDPKLQMQCHFIKSLVLHPEDTMENHSARTTKILDDIMAPKRKVEAENSELFQKLGREFNLQPIQKTKRERVTVEPEDLQAMISEWTVKKELDDAVDDGASQKKKKKLSAGGAKKLSRKEEVQLEIGEDGGAGRVCSKMLEMISNTCKFQSSGALAGFFTVIEMKAHQSCAATAFLLCKMRVFRHRKTNKKNEFKLQYFRRRIEYILLVNELNVIRSVFVENERCDEFNELLKKLKDEEDFEPFAAVLCEEKSCNPISSSEVSSSDISNADAAEFWEEE
ncbi:CBN-CKU-80 protein [Caenorhabditis brenneri]|uniref:CBN-CKU-80 protein n=1 Tax=Caenorhabditis brenneri TaxID=135651 RepID=G0ME57_CAEBE|nr:CBN-CKU-80 protein [Caenorhabditis brenneri]